MVSICISSPPDTDDNVDITIENCLNPESPKSFFLYAGAGSGKTYSLVKGLEAFEKKYGTHFRKKGQKIAVITYTNGACDEIIERVEGDTLFHISTIHSFCWSQIKTFHDDIRTWLLKTIPQDIEELELEESKGRSGTKASATRQKKIAKKQERLAWLSERREFTYNPNGDNLGKASLSHSDVLKICSDFIINKPSFQKVIINRFPFLLIDESQDTNKNLIEAFFKLEEQQKGYFGLGLIGDMMQRIYGDGKSDLGKDIPNWWEKPIKKMNRRSASRIVALANDIRSETDQQKQNTLPNKPDGYVRLFVVSSNKTNRENIESTVKDKMSEITGDTLWKSPDNVKHLILEHKMAAVRMGFLEMYAALDSYEGFKDGLKRGDLSAVRLFSEYVLPLVEFHKSGRSNKIISHLRQVKSPLLDPSTLKNAGNNKNPLHPAQKAVLTLVDAINKNSNITFMEVLRAIWKSELFIVPDILLPFVMEEEDNDSEDMPNKGSSLYALQNFLSAPYDQISAYKHYISGEATFDTHQGIKGREFERVMVVMDDTEAKGFMFSYEKMFEVKDPTSADHKNISIGEDNSLSRTKRLFYVTCTRAEKSLTLVAYTQAPERLKENTIAKGWFNQDEIIVL